MSLISKIEQICNKYQDFDPNEYWKPFHDVTDLNGTQLDNFLKEINTTLHEAGVSPYKVDYLGMSAVRDAEGLEAYFDIIWIQNNSLHSYPIMIESE